MNKKEIEKKIIDECKMALPSLYGLPFDKGLTLLRKITWSIAEKYDTTGDNVFNLIMSNWEDFKKQ